MAQKWHFSILLFSTLILGSNSLKAQTTPRSFFLEPEFSVSLPSKNDWKFTFGVANRYLFNTHLDGEKIEEDEQQHFEINQFTHYRWTQNTSLSLGIRYRFREAFDDSRHDELRIIQQLEYKHNGVLLNPGHRFRFEQRFREETIFRLRYRLAVKQPLGEEFALGLSTEFLHSMIKDNKPETDQRFTFILQNTSFNNLEINAGVELRREDYLGDPASEIYLITGINLQL